jgi:hypothetical protein
MVYKGAGGANYFLPNSSTANFVHLLLSSSVPSWYSYFSKSALISCRRSLYTIPRALSLCSLHVLPSFWKLRFLQHQIARTWEVGHARL